MIKELDALSGSDMYPFHMPGHKRQEIPEDNCQWLDGAYLHDITEIDGFDDLRAPAGIIDDIERRLASLYGADRAFLSVNGSTCGNLSAISALVPRGGLLMTDKEAHSSVFNAAFLGGCSLLYLERETIPDTDLTACVSAEQVEQMLFMANKEGRLPNAVTVTSPTYEGFIADINRIADTAHSYGIPLIADSAHGAHFIKDSSTFFPRLSVKPDITIVSLHKTLPAMTQVSAVLLNGENVRPDDVKRYINIFQTSSPSYILMSSAERCLNIMEGSSLKLKNRLKQNLDRVYALNKRLRNLYLIGDEYIGKYGIAGFDRSRINIIDRTGRVIGRELYAVFREKYHLQPEKAGEKTCLMIAGVMDTNEGFDRLISAIKEMDEQIK